MKRKILLRTLIPLTTVGVTLGATLPLVSCSCNNNQNNGDIHIFYNRQSAYDFAVNTCNALLDPTDANHDWSSNDVDYQPMITWFNEKTTAQFLSLIGLAFYTCRDGLIAFPLEYEYNNDSQQVLTLSVEYIMSSPHAFFTFSFRKETNGFDVVIIADGQVIKSATSCVIDKVGTRNDPQRAINLSQSIGNTDVVNDIWPGIIFPTRYWITI